MPALMGIIADRWIPAQKLLGICQLISAGFLVAAASQTAYGPLYLSLIHIYRNGRVMVQNTRATVKTLSLQSMADFRCKILETHPDGMELRIDGREVWVHFLGRFNAYNLLSVYAAALLLGADRDEVLQACLLYTSHSLTIRDCYEFMNH